jgi:hypothetical protein
MQKAEINTVERASDTPKFPSDTLEWLSRTRKFPIYTSERPSDTGEGQA